MVLPLKTFHQNQLIFHRQNAALARRIKVPKWNISTQCNAIQCMLSIAPIFTHYLNTLCLESLKTGRIIQSFLVGFLVGMCDMRTDSSQKVFRSPFAWFECCGSVLHFSFEIRLNGMRLLIERERAFLAWTLGVALLCTYLFRQFFSFFLQIRQKKHENLLESATWKCWP